MVDFAEKLTSADHTIISTLTWFCTEVHQSPENRVMMAGLLRDAMGFANGDHPIMSPLITAAHEMTAIVDAGELYLGRARHTAEQALSAFAMWSAGRSYEVFRAQYRGEEPLNFNTQEGQAA